MLEEGTKAQLQRLSSLEASSQFPVASRKTLHHEQRFHTLTGSKLPSYLPTETWSHHHHLRGSLECHRKREQKIIHSLLQQSLFSSAPANLKETTDDHRVIPFLLADIGEGIQEVELLQWFVEEGDFVHQFDKVADVQSDKATVDITSRYEGVITKLNGEVGDMLKVGQPLFYIRTNDHSGHTHHNDAHQDDANTASTIFSAIKSDDTRLSIPSAPSHFQLSTPHSNRQTGTDNGNQHKVLTSPAVRKIAKEYQLTNSLDSIRATGPHGRLLKEDVLAFLREQGIDASSTKNRSATETTMDAPPLAPTETNSSATQRQKSQSQQSTVLTEDTVVPLKGYHRLMFQTMTQALQIPHMGLGDEWNLNRLQQFRRDWNEVQGNNNNGDSSIRISLLAFWIKACSVALLEYPTMNAWVVDATDSSCPNKTANLQLLVKASHDIGVAMDTPRGLVVPVLRSVQTKSVHEIQCALNDLKFKAKAGGQFSPEDLEPGPTLTLSNVGSVGGGTYTRPVIVPPQVCIAAFGRMQTVPRYNTTSCASDDYNHMVIEPTSVVNVSWSGDHRFLDGATLSRFNERMKEFVEHPSRLLTQMK